MKLTISERCLRLRVSSREFAELAGGATLSLSPSRVGSPLVVLTVEAGAALDLHFAGAAWRIVLPAGELAAFGSTLPRRDGLRFELDDELSLELEVDVRNR